MRIYKNEQGDLVIDGEDNTVIYAKDADYAIKMDAFTLATGDTIIVKGFEVCYDDKPNIIHSYKND